MLDWILIAALYVFGIAFFRFIGGLDAAGEGMRKWGASYAERQRAADRLPSLARSASARRRRMR